VGGQLAQFLDRLPIQAAGPGIGGDPAERRENLTKPIQDRNQELHRPFQGIGVSEKRALGSVSPVQLEEFDVPQNILKRPELERLLVEVVDPAELAAIPMTSPHDPKQETSGLAGRSDDEPFWNLHSILSLR